MIILGLLNLVTFILSIVFGMFYPFIPEIGPDLSNIIENFMQILDKGIDLFCFLLGPVSSVLIAYILGFQVVRGIWSLIWFIIRKIPMLNIRE